MSKIRLIISYKGKEVFSEVVKDFPAQTAGNYLDFKYPNEKGEVQFLRGEILSVATRPVPSASDNLNTVICWIVEDPAPEVQPS